MQWSNASRSAPSTTPSEWLPTLVAPCHSSVRMRLLPPNLTGFAARKQDTAAAYFGHRRKAHQQELAEM